MRANFRLAAALRYLAVGWLDAQGIEAGDENGLVASTTNITSA